MSYAIIEELPHRVWVMGGLFGAASHQFGPATALEKLSTFSRLGPGWSNGIGDPISPIALSVAAMLINKISDAGFTQTDAFPAVDGGVSVALYFPYGGDLSFRINPNALIDIDSEAEPDFEPIENKNFLEVFELLEPFSVTPWNSSYCSTSPIMMNTSNAFTANRLRAQVMGAVSRLSTENALTAQVVPYAIMRSCTYRQITIDPVIFWQFDSAILPQGVQLVHERSDTSDPCHVNIKGLEKRQSKKFFKRLQKQQQLIFRICASQGEQLATPEDLKREREAFFSQR